MVSYTKEQKADAKRSGRTLATLAVAGLPEFSDVVDNDELRELVEFYLAFTAKHAAKLVKAAEGGAT